MKKKIRTISLVLAIVILAVATVGCGNKDAGKSLWNEKHELEKVINKQKARNVLTETALICDEISGEFSTEKELKEVLDGYMFVHFGLLHDEAYERDEHYYVMVPKADVKDYVYDVFGLKVNRVKSQQKGIKYSKGVYHICPSNGPESLYTIKEMEETEKGYQVRVDAYDNIGKLYCYFLFQIENCDNANGMKIVGITRHDL